MKRRSEMVKIKASLGNKELLNLHKIGFLCSREIPTRIVLKSYDWAIKMRDEGKCVISGFHSTIEKDVLHFLLKGKQPIILILGRGMKKRFEPELKMALEEKRLLVISPFNEQTTRVTKETAFIRNRLILQLTDEIYIPYVHPGGMLEKLLNEFGRKIFDMKTKEALTQVLSILKSWEEK
jgi:predicted Rossmann fold nucleotide-binding protein DprA/Smf involved in DNA uptake